MLKANFKKQLHTFELDIDFQADLEVLGILGPSGCGKSMTLKCIAGIETPDSGYIELDGVVLYDSARKINLSPQKRHVGYLFQHYALFPTMSVEQNLLTGIRPDQAKDSREKSKQVLQTLKLEGVEKKKPHLLSGGQRQRVALGRILLNSPHILMLDEPLSALDQFLKWRVQLDLLELFERWQKTVLLVTHNREEIFQLCDSVTVLTDGKNDAKQTVTELFSAPQSLSAGVLAGYRNFSKIEIIDLEKGLFKALDWGVALHSPKLTQNALHCGAFSQSLKVIGEKDQETENVIPVACLHQFGKMENESLVCSTPGGNTGNSILYIELHKGETLPPGKSESFSISIPAQDLIFFDG